MINLTSEKEIWVQRALRGKDRIILCPVCGESHGIDFLEITDIGVQEKDENYISPFEWVFIYCNWSDKGTRFVN